MEAVKIIKISSTTFKCINTKYKRGRIIYFPYVVLPLRLEDVTKIYECDHEADGKTSVKEASP